MFNNRKCHNPVTNPQETKVSPGKFGFEIGKNYRFSLDEKEFRTEGTGQLV